MNFELFDKVLKDLDELHNQIESAEQAYGKIIDEDLWTRLLKDLKELLGWEARDLENIFNSKIKL